jgi:hypothetical protein
MGIAPRILLLSVFQTVRGRLISNPSGAVRRWLPCGRRLVRFVSARFGSSARPISGWWSLGLLGSRSVTGGSLCCASRRSFGANEQAQEERRSHFPSASNSFHCHNTGEGACTFWRVRTSLREAPDDDASSCRHPLRPKCPRGLSGNHNAPRDLGHGPGCVLGESE